MARTPSYATKKDLSEHKKEVIELIKKATKKIKNWDVKQDKKLIKKSKNN